MMQIHRSDERGGGDHGWLKSKFSFSFADYYNPDRMGFGKLRVLNDDIIAPHSGFPPHPHRDMEIITIVKQGEITHEDSTGSVGVVNEGMVQVMSAGSGVVHSEYNNSDEELRLFQIWIETKSRIEPRYGERHFNIKENSLTTVASENQGLFINQDASVSIGKFKEGASFKHSPSEGKGIFILIVEGRAEVNQEILNRRDSIETDSDIEMKFLEDCEFMLIEVPI